MEIRLLRDFLVISTKLNFSRAAEQLHMTQPVLSRHIKILEDNLGVQLLRRDTHRVALTPAGVLFAEEVRKALAQYDACIESVRAYATRGLPPVSIAFQSHATRQILSSFLLLFSESHQSIKIDCYDTDLDSLLAHIDQGACDVAFAVRANGGAVDRRLSYFLVFKDLERAVMHKNHPLAGRSSISVHDFTNWPVIGLSRQLAPMAARTSLYSLERHGVEYKLAGEYPNLESCLFNLDFNERAMLLCPGHRLGNVGPNCVTLPLDEKDCWLNVELVWNARSPNPSMKLFIEEFQKFSEGSNWLHKSGDEAGSREFA